MIGVRRDEILAKLSRYKVSFETVRTPTLVHWDMWEGNIFVKDGNITEIIDWERAMWGEPFMDDRFRYHNRHNDFLKGFGINEFSKQLLLMNVNVVIVAVKGCMRPRNFQSSYC